MLGGLRFQLGDTRPGEERACREINLVGALTRVERGMPLTVFLAKAAPPRLPLAVAPTMVKGVRFIV